MKAASPRAARVRTVHDTAIISPGARLGRDVEVGPYAVIGPQVVVGDSTRIGPHVVIGGRTTIGANCTIDAGVCIGGEPQDLKYRGEDTAVIIGDNNTIREYVTIHRGTASGRGVTVVGNDNMIMAYAHVAHDCVVGSHCILTHACGLGGHSVVEDNAILGGMSGVHQFVRVGQMAMVGGMAKVTNDVPPFCLVDGNPARVVGVNVVGLKRNGMDQATRAEIRKAFKLLYRSGLALSAAVERMAEELAPLPEILHLIEFLQASGRGITPPSPQI